MKKFYTLILLLLSSILVINTSSTITYASSEPTGNYVKFFDAFDTDIAISIEKRDPLAKNYNKYFSEAEEILGSLSRLTDNFKSYPKDKVTNVNDINNKPGQVLEIDKVLYDILEYSLELKELTEGYFDVSIGLIVDGWKDIIKNQSNNKIPPSEKYTKEEIDTKIDEIKQIPVIDDGIILRSNNGVYTVEIKEGVKIDLGAIAKGYGVQLVHNYFKSEGLNLFFIKGSDSSLSFSEKTSENDNKYKLGIGNPYYLTGESKELVYGSVQIKNTSVTTSGDTIQSVNFDGRTLHHIISPITKQPENFYRIVTIIHPDAGYSDAMTTALFSMNPEKFANFINKLDGNDETKLSGYIQFGYNKNNVNNQLKNGFYDGGGVTPPVEGPNNSGGNEEMKSKFRDFLIISSIIIIAAIGIYMFGNAYKNAKYDYSTILYRGEEVARVNFKNSKITIEEQADTKDLEQIYPYINYEKETITILGYPQEKIRGADELIIKTEDDGKVRYELVIKYNFDKRTMQVIEEVSPNNSCKIQGESNALGISCIPNRVDIKFKNIDNDNDFDAEI